MFREIKRPLSEVYKENLPAIKGLIDGKKLECFNLDFPESGWYDVYEYFRFDTEHLVYRIKPEPHRFYILKDVKGGFCLAKHLTKKSANEQADNLEQAGSNGPYTVHEFVEVL